jgi:glycerol uptake facilitator-like aquaporin
MFLHFRRIYSDLSEAKIINIRRLQLDFSDPSLTRAYGKRPQLPDTLKKALAEFIATAMLVCVVVASGIQAVKLSADGGVQLLINISSIVLALTLIILVVGPISGAQLNPVVSIIEWVTKVQSLGRTLAFILAQFAGAIIGAIFANLMFDLPPIQFSDHARVTTGTIIGEVVATAGLVAVIGILAKRGQNKFIPFAVSAWVYSACFFTSSTCFANPAVTVGRVFSDTYVGIAPESVIPFIAAQLLGGAVGLGIVKITTRG